MRAPAVTNVVLDFCLFTTPNFSRVIELVNDGLSTRVRVGAVSPPPAWMW